MLLNHGVCPAIWLSRFMNEGWFSLIPGALSKPKNTTLHTFSHVLCKPIFFFFYGGSDENIHIIIINNSTHG